MTHVHFLVTLPNVFHLNFDYRRRGSYPEFEAHIGGEHPDLIGLGSGVGFRLRLRLRLRTTYT